MRKFTIAAFSLFMTIGILMGGLWINGRATTMQLNKRDFPEQGLTIITAADPSFNDLIALYQQHHPNALVEELRLFSGFIRNDAPHAIVGYALKWECARADGTVVTKSDSVTTLWALTNAGGANQAAAIARAQTVIPSNSIMFFSLAAPSVRLDQMELNSAQPSPEQRELLRNLRTEFASYASVTVAFDGVFFADGSFIGPDTIGYFADVQAQVTARYDILHEIVSVAQQGRPSSEAFSRAQEAADGPKIDFSHSLSVADRYNYYRRMFAREMVGIRRGQGDDKALERAHRLLSRPWPRLRRR